GHRRGTRGRLLHGAHRAPVQRVSRGRRAGGRPGRRGRRDPRPGKGSPMNFVAQYLTEAAQVAALIDHDAVTRLVDLLREAREGGGPLFVLGVGGSAGNASHAVNDFRKIAGFEAYAPTDNVSALTARINDDGWDTSFANWLKVSRLTSRDCLLVFSVGGGDVARKVSMNLVTALQYARSVGAKIGGIVGRD